MNEPRVVDIKDWQNFKKEEGNYCVLYRREKRQLARILEVLNDKQCRYELIGGDENGLIKTGYYFASTVKIYDESNKHLAQVESDIEKKLIHEKTDNTVVSYEPVGVS